MIRHQLRDAGGNELEITMERLKGKWNIKVGGVNQHKKGYDSYFKAELFLKAVLRNTLNRGFSYHPGYRSIPAQSFLIITPQAVMRHLKQPGYVCQYIPKDQVRAVVSFINGEIKIYPSGGGEMVQAAKYIEPLRTLFGDWSTDVVLEICVSHCSFEAGQRPLFTALDILQYGDTVLASEIFLNRHTLLKKVTASTGLFRFGCFGAEDNDFITPFAAVKELEKVCILRHVEETRRGERMKVLFR